MGTNQGKIEKLTAPTTNTMKFLIVLGLIPLFSAQQMGFLGFPNMMGLRQTQGRAQAQGNPKKEYDNNNNNLWGLMFPGFRTLSSGTGGKKSYSSNGNNDKENQKNNLFGLTELNNQLIQSMRFMTDSLVTMFEQVAQDSRTDEVFKVMDKICVSNMDEAIEALKLGTNAAEQALLESTKLLDDAVEGKVKLDKEGLEAAQKSAEEAFKKLSSSDKSQGKMKY